MANEIEVRKPLALTPRHAQSLSQQELEDHRAEICSDVEMILDGYWDKRPSEEMKARILANWADQLEDYKAASVLHALRKWCREKPDKTPNVGHILGILSEGWGRKQVRGPTPD